MFDPSSATWSGFSTATQAALESLRNLNVEQCRPLVLAAMRKLSAGELERLIPLVLNWSVRWLVVGGGSAGTTEKLYATTAMKVTDGQLTTSASVAAEFDGSAPSDLAFKSAFENLSVRRGWLSRYLLTVLERAKNADPEPELVPNQDVDAVNLEHVLPKSPDATWFTAFSQEEVSLLVHRLGNHCLLAKSPNKNIGNQPFSVKRPVLAASAFRLTNEIGQVADWTPEAIHTRQGQLAELAVTAWRRS